MPPSSALNCLLQCVNPDRAPTSSQCTKLSSLCERDLRSSLMLLSVDWCLATDVSGQPIGTIFSGQSVQVTLEEETDSLCRRSSANYQSTLFNIPQQPKSQSQHILPRSIIQFRSVSTVLYKNWSNRNRVCPSHILWHVRRHHVRRHRRLL